MRRWVAMLGIALAACGGSDGDEPASRATVPRTPASTTPADPYAVPATIDAAYLNRVFAALEEIDGQATRLILAHKAYVPDAALRLNAIYGKEEFDRQTNNWVDLINEGLTGFKSPPGNRRTTVRRIITARPDCLFLEVASDYRAIIVDQKAPTVQWMTLRPLAHDRDPRRFNPTPWMITAEGFNTDRSQPPDPCVS